MSTRIRKTACAIAAGAAVLGAIAGCADAPTARGVDPAAAESSDHGGHGGGTHKMPDGTTMSNGEMPAGGAGTHVMPDGTTMSNGEAPAGGAGHGGHAGHGGQNGLALWATQKSGGKLLVLDGDGRPFYRSQAGAACTGACAAGWEPVTVDPSSPPQLLGVQRSAVGTVAGPGGAPQLTLDGAPLFRRPGPPPAQPDPREFAATGWYPVSPSGEPVTG